MAIDEKASYYDVGGIETFDIIRAKLPPEQFRGYLLGSALAYLCRLGHKPDTDPARDVEKALVYLKLLKTELEDVDL